MAHQTFAGRPNNSPLMKLAIRLKKTYRGNLRGKAAEIERGNATEPR